MNTKHALRLLLDPAEILRAQHLAPDPWQQDLLRSPHRQVLLNCSRQAGKSTTLAALALHTALFRPESLILLLSPSLRQSRELFRKVQAAYRALGRPMKTLQDNQTRFELSNRSRIVCLPGREGTVRSFSGVTLLVLDEAARVPDELYRSVRPMLAVSRGRLVCLSTPFGQRGFFFEEWQHGGPAWHRVRITWRDCPRITADFIEQERHSLGASWVGQEYECSFESLEGLVYPDFEAQVAVDEEGPATGKEYGGIDWGFRNPFAALWGRLDRHDVLTITGERYVRETPLHEHARALPRQVTWFADPSGAQEINGLRSVGLVVRRGDNDIRAGIAAVRARLQTGRLRVVRGRCPNLLAEARLYRYPTRKDGRAASEVPVDEHNHALAALRYLVSRLDARFIARFRKQEGQPALEEEAAEPAPRSQSHLDQPAPWRTILGGG
jgi:hypothetical protein